MNKIEDIKYKIISDTNEDDDGDNYLQINIKGVNINTIIFNIFNLVHIDRKSVV